MELAYATPLASPSCFCILPHLSGKAQGPSRRNATPGQHPRFVSISSICPHLPGMTKLRTSPSGPQACAHPRHSFILASSLAVSPLRLCGRRHPALEQLEHPSQRWGAPPTPDLA